MRLLVTLLPALTLSACATTMTARMHSEAELNVAAQACGFALGELAQDQEEKRLLFVMPANPTVAKQTCVRQWAKRNGLQTVFIDGVEFAQ